MDGYLDKIGEDLGIGIPVDQGAAAGLNEFDNVFLQPAPKEEEIPDALEKELEKVDNTGEVAKEEVKEETPKVEEENKSEEDKQAEYLKQIKEASAEQPNDSSVIKDLRSLLKVRVEELDKPINIEPTLTESQREAVEVFEKLFDFDPDNSKPSTIEFAKYLGTKDINLAHQTLVDIANLPMPIEGIENWTLGHQYLQSIGLDPFKIEELRQYSNGEIEKPQAIQQNFKVPDYVPEEYAKAYINLSDVIKADIDIYLQSDKPEQKAAATTLLQDKHKALAVEEKDIASRQQAVDTFHIEVKTETEAELGKTLDNLLNAIKSNEVYTNIKVSANEMVDKALKDSIINHINYLGEENPILEKRALEYFKDVGIDIDLPKVKDLIETIQKNTKIIISADKTSKLDGKNYDVQKEAAIGRRDKAISNAISLGNKYFQESVSKLSQGNKNIVDKDTTKDLPPSLKDGDNPTERSNGNKPMTMAELDAFVLGTAKGIRESSSS